MPAASHTFRCCRYSRSSGVFRKSPDGPGDINCLRLHQQGVRSKSCKPLAGPDGVTAFSISGRPIKRILRYRHKPCSIPALLPLYLHDGAPRPVPFSIQKRRQGFLPTAVAPIQARRLFCQTTPQKAGRRRVRLYNAVPRLGINKPPIW